MVHKLVAIATFIVLAEGSSPAISGQLALTPTNVHPTSTEQAQGTTANEVVEACAQGRAEELPIPFSDVSPDHWAFEAVMTMHYCGAYRPPVPPDVIRHLLLPNRLPNNS